MAMKTWWSELPNERLTETAWERQMFSAGFDAFDSSRRDASGNARAASEISTGQTLIRKMLDTGAKSVEAMQKSVLGIPRSDNRLKATVLMVPPETSALITLRVLMDLTYGVEEVAEGVPYIRVCERVSKSIEMELNFRNWIRKSRDAAQIYAKEKGLAKAPTSFAEQFIKENSPSRFVMNRMKKAIADLNEYSWDTLEQHYCGDSLVSAVIEAMPENFERFMLRKASRQENRVRMTDDLKQRFDRMEMKAMMNSAIKKPMLTKPKKWTKEEV